MWEQFSRTERLFGKKAVEQLMQAKVAVFGIGGVGGHALEALVRSGVGSVDIIDNDKVCLSNLNRQIIATHKTLGQYKVDVAEERMKEINPDVVIHKYQVFFLPETSDRFDFSKYDYVVDCIDTVVAKVELVVRCNKQNIPIISSMGAGNKLDATAFKVSDISKTKIDPLAKAVRKRLRKLGVEHLKVVYSEEVPNMTSCQSTELMPASNSFVPGVAGLIIGGEVIKDIIHCTNLL